MTDEEQKVDLFLRVNPLAFEIMGFMLESDSRSTITEISNALGRKQPSVHRALQRLLELKLVEKEPSGKLVYYKISAAKKKMVELSIHAQTHSRRNVQPPLFMLLSIESSVSRILSESLQRANLRITRNKIIPGRHFDHEFDVMIENKTRIGIEIVSSDENDRRLFEVVGRIADLSKSSIDRVVLVIVGHLHQSSLQYLKSLSIKDAPKIDVTQLDEPLLEINEETIRRKVVTFIERLLK